MLGYNVILYYGPHSVSETAKMYAKSRPERLLHEYTDQGCRGMKVWMVCVLIFVGMLSGCSSMRMIRSRLPSPGLQLAQRGFYKVVSPRTKFSEQTEVSLRTLNLEKLAKEKPEKAIEELQQMLKVSWKYELVGMTAEVAFEGAQLRQMTDPQTAAALYVTATENAWRYLFDDSLNKFRNPYDPTFAEMCRIYNKSVENLLRLMARRNVLQLEDTDRLSLVLKDGSKAFELRMFSKDWTFSDFENFQFASDFDVTGFKNRYRLYGIGVPLVAKTRNLAGKPTKYHYCIENLCVSMSVFLRLEDGRTPVLEFYDPVEYSKVKIGSFYVPLEIDYTTPLAYTISLGGNKPYVSGTVGLLHPDELLKRTADGSREIKGIYMAQPYDPKKIPVVLVHGLWSSPKHWMEMYNTLSSLDTVRDKYQFWFYFYPNGQPFWVSASQFRDDLEAARTLLDPRRENANLDRMVLVGHSMGGLISLLQTMNTEEKLWNLITSKPPEELSGPEPSHTEVPRWFHYRANPSVSCVITMAVPFRGSHLANRTTRNIPEILGRQATLVEKNLQQFREENASEIENSTLLTYDNSIASLQAGTIVWDALMSCEHAPWTTYYNIDGQTYSTLGQPKNSDGVVSHTSSQLPWAASETRVDAEHSDVPANPAAILAVARILIEKCP